MWWHWRRKKYFKIFSASFWITFLSPGIVTFINVHVPFHCGVLQCLACYWGWSVNLYVLATTTIIIIIINCLLTAIELSLEPKQIRINTHKRNNTKSTVQTIQNTVNTSAHITKIHPHNCQNGRNFCGHQATLSQTHTTVAISRGLWGKWLAGPALCRQ
jgi:hypothetical protein